MKVSFYLTTPKHVSASNFIAGGAEMAAKGLGDALCTLGHEVHYYGNTEPSECYHSYDDFENDEHDRAIVVRAHPVLARTKAQKLILWSGDAYDQPNNILLNDMRVVNNVHKFVFKSEWQMRTNLIHYAVLDCNRDKVCVLPNGVHVEHYFKYAPSAKDWNAYICTSRIFRGIDKFTYIWPRILHQWPESVLHLYVNISGLYSDDNVRDSKYEVIFNALRNMPNTKVHDTASQVDVVKKMSECHLMLYPNFGFMESSCNSALESMCAGTPVITTAKAGLLETVGWGEGKLIPDNLKLQQYADEMIKHILWYKEHKDTVCNWVTQERHSLIKRFDFVNIAKRWVKEVLN